MKKVKQKSNTQFFQRSVDGRIHLHSSVEVGKLDELFRIWVHVQKRLMRFHNATCRKSHDITDCPIILPSTFLSALDGPFRIWIEQFMLSLEQVITHLSQYIPFVCPTSSSAMLSVPSDASEGTIVRCCGRGSLHTNDIFPSSNNHC
jgi:hypothetical protein